MVAVLLAAPLAGVPLAAAYDCEGVNPAETCGPCTSGDHKRVDATTQTVYCESHDDPPPEPERCIITSSQISIPPVIC